MIDRCDLTTLDIVIGNIVLWSLYLADFLMTYHSLRLARQWRPRKYQELEYNVLYRFFLKRFGLKGMLYAFPISTALFVVLLVLFPFVTTLLIGYLLAMVLSVHLPNLKLLNKKVRAVD